jgi:hypothetical protein
VEQETVIIEDLKKSGTTIAGVYQVFCKFADCRKRLFTL